MAIPIAIATDMSTHEHTWVYEGIAIASYMSVDEY